MGTGSLWEAGNDTLTPPAGQVASERALLLALLNGFTAGTNIARNFRAMAAIDLGGGTADAPTTITMAATGAAVAAPTSPVALLNGYERGMLIVKLVRAGTVQGPGQFILQGSPDDGTTWIDICSPDTTAAGDTLGELYVASFGAAPSVGSNSAPAKQTAGTMAARTNGQGVWFDRVRLWEKVTGTWSVAPQYTALLVTQS